MTKIKLGDYRIVTFLLYDIWFSLHTFSIIAGSVIQHFCLKTLWHKHFYLFGNVTIVVVAASYLAASSPDT
jgi:hypothetical protein